MSPPPRIELGTDDTEWGLPTASPGLRLEVPASGRWRERPSLHVEAAGRYLLRVNGLGQALLWARVDDWWDACGFFRGHALMAGGLPPLTAADVRGITAEPGSSAWWQAWMRHFVSLLADAPASPLYAGAWSLWPLQPVPPAQAASYPSVPVAGLLGMGLDPPHSLEQALRFERFWVEPWQWSAFSTDELPHVRSGAVLALRPASAAQDGRVKAWRKHARDGTLPPVLLWALPLLGKWLVLDGHDRLQAALLEGRPPPLLGLWHFAEEAAPEDAARREGALLAAQARLRARSTPADVDAANRLLLREHAPCRRGAVIRAWALRGGKGAWQADVQRQRGTLLVPEDDWEWFVQGDE